jgi:hypothetical protein
MAVPANSILRVDFVMFLSGWLRLCHAGLAVFVEFCAGSCGDGRLSGSCDAAE